MTRAPAKGLGRVVELVRVGVVGGPPAGSALLGALEQAFPVRFESCARQAVEDLPATLFLDCGAVADHGCAGERGRPAYVVASMPPASERVPAEIAFSDVPELDQRLRGARIVDDGAGSIAPLRPPEGATILAESSGRPLWARVGQRHLVALAPTAREQDRTLLEMLRPGRWLSLLPLVHFLRELVGDVGFAPPPLRASFLIDDPNLRRPRYGFLAYNELAGHSDVHNYHAAFAMIPIDRRAVHARTARLFRDHPERLSLLTHGNDHLKRELAQTRSESETVAMLGQAQRRLSEFERRANLRVARVMAPPHGACSLTTARALPRLGFEAACISRPYPWLEAPPRDRVLAGWEPAALVAAGTPVIPRVPLKRAAEEIRLRAFLDQPLVLYGHHDDFATGLDLFAELAAQVNGLGETRWESLERIARSNYATRVHDGVLSVRSYSRHVHVAVPEGTEAIAVELPTPDEVPAWSEVLIGGCPHPLVDRGTSWSSDPAPLDGRRTVDIVVPHPGALDPASVPPRRSGTWAPARRTLSEVRDRIAPVRRLAGRGR